VRRADRAENGRTGKARTASDVVAASGADAARRKVNDSVRRGRL